MFCEINLRDADPQFLRDFLHGPLLQNVAIKNLVLLSTHLPFHPFGRGLEQIAPPFFVPRRVEIESRRIGDLFDRRRLVFIAASFRGLFPNSLSLSELIRNPPACNVQEPAFE